MIDEQVRQSWHEQQPDEDAAFGRGSGTRERGGRWKVHQILDERIRCKQPQLLIKWADWHDVPTWHPRSDFRGTQQLQMWQQRGPIKDIVSERVQDTCCCCCLPAMQLTCGWWGMGVGIVCLCRGHHGVHGEMDSAAQVLGVLGPPHRAFCLGGPPVGGAFGGPANTAQVFKSSQAREEDQALEKRCVLHALFATVTTICCCLSACL